MVMWCLGKEESLVGARCPRHLCCPELGMSHHSGPQCSGQWVGGTSSKEPAALKG